LGGANRRGNSEGLGGGTSGGPSNITGNYSTRQTNLSTEMVQMVENLKGAAKTPNAIKDINSMFKKKHFEFP